MKKLKVNCKKIIFVGLILCISNVYSQTFETIPLPTEAIGKNLFSVKNFNNNYYVAGDNVLLKSTDLGETWFIMLYRDTICFYDVEFYDENIGFAVGMNKNYDFMNRRSLFFRTDDGGLTWNYVYEPIEHASSNVHTPYIDFPEWSVRNGAVCVFNQNRIFASVGDRSYYSNTGGRVYYYNLGGFYTFAAYQIDEDKLYLASTGGVYASNYCGYPGAGGEYLDVEYSVFDIDFVPNTKGFGIVEPDLSEKTNLLIIENGVASQIPISLIGNTVMFGLDFLNTKIGYIVGSNGTVIKTMDGGNNFEFVSSGSTEQLNKICFANSNNAIIVGNNGTLLKTINANINTKPLSGKNIKLELSNWEKIELSNSITNFNKIETTENNAYVAGNGLVLKSIDYGKTWTTTFEDPTMNFRLISFVSDDIGWIGGWFSPGFPTDDELRLYKTIDGGLNWTLQNTFYVGSGNIGNSEPPMLKTKDENTILILTAKTNVFEDNTYYSIDGGVSWLSYNSEHVLIDFDFVETNSIIGSSIGQSNMLYKTNFMNSCCFSGYIGCAGVTLVDAEKYYGTNAFDFFKNPSTNKYTVFIANDMYQGENGGTYKGRMLKSDPFTFGTTSSDILHCKDTYIPTYMYGIDCKNEQEVWMCGEKGILAKTFVGGEIPDLKVYNLWNGVETFTNNRLQDIKYFPDDTTIIAVGNNNSIVRTNCDYIRTIPTISINGNSISTDLTSNFQWYYDGQVMNETISTFTPEFDGSYSVVVTDENGCKTASNPLMYDINSSSSIQNNQSSKINVYPNPCSNSINIVEFNISNAIFEIYNNFGQVVKTGNLINNNTIQISNLSSGLYYLKIYELSNVYFSKFIKL